MDTEFARTFLAVVAAGNFVGAAEQLHLTQSTVSARIKALERQFGVTLLQRGRHGAELTPAGKRFLRHAKGLVQTVEQARHDVGLPSGYSGSLTLRARIALWDGFLTRWSVWMRRRMPDVSLRLEIGFEEDTMQALVQGTADLGAMYTPQNRPGLGIEHLFDERLMLVSTDRDGDWLNHGYVHVDWGPEFEAQFATRYPNEPAPALQANVGWLGVQRMLAVGGAGFFPCRMTRELVEAGQLWPVADAPLISLPVYLVYPQDRNDDAMKTAIEGLRLLSAEERSCSA
ncbi:LysR family transcriptional regulator [Marinobacterium nitratireducens]|uniref:LysR family transcriptional regulator n=1 Tax=Marinobacterium nitratireducens TaxID=518897 RepID=A0A917ZPY6_9GAMM|nr:LysR family transcriptional regulator [Marinobacterium nitratireducens]GGO87997.1 LysR family transcriptional regulator [Marinobacterium nitratireducens]